MPDQLDSLCIDTLRFLAVDMVQHANSGHPGLPLGAAPMAYALWTRQLKHHPVNPHWADRDRFVLSAGHGSALLYSLLHLTGYDLSLDDIRQFRQWGSKAPGHPERGHTPGVEVTTGPLGQGLANAVGLAIGEAHLAARYNRDGHTVIDHHTWAIISDGDLMEGIASEAASLAGHLQLGKLICLYDDNSVTLSAATDITFSEDRAQRFEAFGWQILHVADGNDVAAISAALDAARADTARPSLILVRTHIGFGSPEQDSYKAHGSPLGVEGVKKTKEKLGWPVDPPFRVPQPALAHFRAALQRGARAEAEWNGRLDAYARAFPELASELQGRLRGELPAGWDADIPVFPADARGMATRVASGRIMNAFAPKLPALVGHPYRAEGAGRLQPGPGIRHGPRRLRPRRLELRRPQPAFRRARTCDGRDRQWPRRTWRFHPLRRHLPDLLRLHAPGNPPGRGTAGFAQPAGSSGAEQCSAKPRLRPSQEGRLCF